MFGAKDFNDAKTTTVYRRARRAQRKQHLSLATDLCCTRHVPCWPGTVACHASCNFRTVVDHNRVVCAIPGIA